MTPTVADRTPKSVHFMGFDLYMLLEVLLEVIIYSMLSGYNRVLPFGYEILINIPVCCFQAAPCPCPWPVRFVEIRVSVNIMASTAVTAVAASSRDQLDGRWSILV